jgi:phosphomannomutase
MISLAAKQFDCQIGIILTASHNPPSYNGFKLKAFFGGPLAPWHVQEVEDIIPDSCPVNYNDVSLDGAISAGQLEIVDIETRYVDHVKANFDLDAIANSGLNLVYDAMYGAGQNVLKRILPNTQFLHCDYNPSFHGQAPEPIAKNLKELEAYIKEKGNIHCALATDGDADRIGLYNGKGEFVDSHHIILLLIHYMVKYKQMTGKVVIAFSVTPRVEKMCKHYGLELQTTKIGFKEIASIMVEDDVLLGGEESGGGFACGCGFVEQAGGGFIRRALPVGGGQQDHLRGVLGQLADLDFQFVGHGC